ncbi:thioredoxin [Nitzschia inconspicua]|uniref:Thioredoxin n=1 Tax=Nitzschia inconspicua TaxID=303405 RepID=A0A9K3PSZ1_9STRA|nr:thioredoxin [Nitzschia inconspicua]
MDLGFGDRNNEIGQATAQALLTGAQVQEQSLDAELTKFDRLLDDDDALETLRQKRLEELQSTYTKQQKWKSLGHGTYQELTSGGSNTNDVAKDFFQASKESERLVVHFYRPSTRLCDVFHAHLSKLAPKHLETRFVKINVEGCDAQEGSGASYLVEKLGIVVMPTLVLIKNRQAFHHIRGFDEFGGNEDFSSNVLAYVLGKNHGILDLRDDEEVSDEVLQYQGINKMTIRKIKSAKKGYYDDEEDEFE